MFFFHKEGIKYMFNPFSLSIELVIQLIVKMDWTYTWTSGTLFDFHERQKLPKERGGEDREVVISGLPKMGSELLQ
jgi:hypothetical protein